MCVCVQSDCANTYLYSNIYPNITDTQDLLVAKCCCYVTGGRVRRPRCRRSRRKVVFAKITPPAKNTIVMKQVVPRKLPGPLMLHVIATCLSRLTAYLTLPQHCSCDRLVPANTHNACLVHDLTIHSNLAIVAYRFTSPEVPNDGYVSFFCCIQL